MPPTKRLARIAGFLYLLVTITGLFTLMYVPSKLFVRADPAATVNNILAHEALFRADIAVGLASELLFIALVLVLYRLLKDVNRTLAGVMVLLVLLVAPLAFVGEAYNLATLAFARGAQFLSAFDKPQRDALATLVLGLDREQTLVAEMFWGLWLLPLAVLVFRSGFLPRILGGWLFVNGIAYVAISLTGILMPGYLEIANKIALPALMGELALMLWLLVVGVRLRPATDKGKGAAPQRVGADEGSGAGRPS